LALCPCPSNVCVFVFESFVHKLGGSECYMKWKLLFFVVLRVSIYKHVYIYIYPHPPCDSYSNSLYGDSVIVYDYHVLPELNEDCREATHNASIANSGHFPSNFGYQN
jgi:hypothetical protein